MRRGHSRGGSRPQNRAGGTGPRGRPDHHGRERAEAANRNIRQVVGLHAAREVLKIHPSSVREIWLAQGFERNAELNPFAEWAAQRKVRVYAKPEAALKQIADSHQGVCVRVEGAPEFDLSTLKNLPEDAKVRIVALDGITDPHNLGAVLRTAWLLGATALIVPEHRSAALTPSAIKVASGGAEHVPVVQVTNLQAAVTNLKDYGFWIFGLDHRGSQPLTKTQFPERVVVIVGAEDKGIRPSVLNICDQRVSIPQADPAASFNASVAAAITLFEVSRQHQNPSK